MKRIVSLILVGVFLSLSAALDRPQCQAQWQLPILVIAATAGAGLYTIWIMTKNSEPKIRYYVLEKSYLDGNWTPICTNCLRMVPEVAFRAFEAKMTDSCAFYRVHEIPKPDGWLRSPQTNPDGPATDCAYP